MDPRFIEAMDKCLLAAERNRLAQEKLLIASLGIDLIWAEMLEYEDFVINRLEEDFQ